MKGENVEVDGDHLVTVGSNIKCEGSFKVCVGGEIEIPQHTWGE